MEILQVREGIPAGQRGEPNRSGKGTLQVREGNPAGQRRETCRSEKGTLQVREVYRTVPAWEVWEGNPAANRREPRWAEKGPLQGDDRNPAGKEKPCRLRGTLQAKRNPAG